MVSLQKKSLVARGFFCAGCCVAPLHDVMLYLSELADTAEGVKMNATAETTQYRNHELSSSFDHESSLLAVTVHDAGQLSLRDAADTSYWFAYSNLGTGPRIESRGAVRNEDGSITTTYRV